MEGSPSRDQQEGERKRSRVETPLGSRGGKRGKAKAKGGCGAVPAAAAAAWATGRARSALRRCGQSSSASPAPLGRVRCTDPCRPNAGPRGIASLSHFVPSLLGRLLRCPAGQGEVGARCRLGKVGERAVRKTRVGSGRLLTRELLEVPVAPAGERASGDGECLGGGARGAVRD